MRAESSLSRARTFARTGLGSFSLLELDSRRIDKGDPPPQFDPNLSVLNGCHIIAA